MMVARFLLASVIVALPGCATNSGRLMTWEEYRDVSVQWPYTRTFQDSHGALLYFGARHTYEAGDPQVTEIARLWDCFRPTIALNEGGHPPVEASLERAVENHGEAGLIRFLAARDDVPVTSLDPDRAEEVAHLRRSFSPIDVKLFFVLRSAAQFSARNGPAGVDEEIRRVLTIYNGRPGLSGQPTTVADLAAEFVERFPSAVGYEETPLNWFDPTLSETWLNEVSRTASEYRDRSMVRLLSEHVRDGHRVFAVVGGTHVVMQERALSEVLGVRGSRRTRGCS